MPRRALRHMEHETRPMAMHAHVTSRWCARRPGGLDEGHQWQWHSLHMFPSPVSSPDPPMLVGIDVVCRLKPQCWKDDHPPHPPSGDASHEILGHTTHLHTSMSAAQHLHIHIDILPHLHIRTRRRRHIHRRIDKQINPPYACTYLSIYKFIYILFVCLSVYLSICQSIYRSIYLSI